MKEVRLRFLNRARLSSIPIANRALSRWSAEPARARIARRSRSSKTLTSGTKRYNGSRPQFTKPKGPDASRLRTARRSAFRLILRLGFNKRWRSANSRLAFGFRLRLLPQFRDEVPFAKQVFG